MNFSRLINYSMDMCWNGQGTAVVVEVKDIGNQPPNPWFRSFCKGLQLPFPNERHFILQNYKSNWANYNWVAYTVVHEWFQHKLNHFLLCQNFEKKLFITCAKKIINYCKIKYLQVFDCPVWTADLRRARVR